MRRQKSKLTNVGFRHFAETIFEREILINVAKSSGTTISLSSGSLLGYKQEKKCKGRLDKKSIIYKVKVQGTIERLLRVWH